MRAAFWVLRAFARVMIKPRVVPPTIPYIPHSAVSTGLRRKFVFFHLAVLFSRGTMCVGSRGPTVFFGLSGSYHNSQRVRRSELAYTDGRTDKYPG